MCSWSPAHSYVNVNSEWNTKWQCSRRDQLTRVRVQAETCIGWVRVKTETWRGSEPIRQCKNAFHLGWIKQCFTSMSCKSLQRIQRMLWSRDTNSHRPQNIVLMTKLCLESKTQSVQMLLNPWQDQDIQKIYRDSVSRQSTTTLPNDKVYCEHKGNIHLGKCRMGWATLSHKIHFPEELITNPNKKKKKPEKANPGLQDN